MSAADAIRAERVVDFLRAGAVAVGVGSALVGVADSVPPLVTS